MKKITVEFIRLGLIGFAFLILMALNFAYVNQYNSTVFQALAELFTIPAILITAITPLWMIVDLIRKNVADKSIFNLTFFISIISLFLMGFMMLAFN